MRRDRAVVLLAYVAVLAACVEVPQVPIDAPVAADSGSSVPTAPVTFELPGIVSGVVQSADFLGRPTLVVFAATYDTLSQAAVPMASAVVRRHRPRLNALLIVFEPPENRPLAAAFVAAMDVAFPVALADSEMLEGHGAFPGLRHVPSFVLLDRMGREVWRRYGLVTVEVLNAALLAHEPP